MVETGRVISLLSGEYAVPDWRRKRDPLSTLVQTILSQNTSDTNSGRAFASLRAVFPDWAEVAKTPVERIAKTIKVGGLGEIKAQRIKQALAEIVRRHGRLELDFLDELPLEEGRQWLKQLPGVGDKTAGVVLLFALGKSALPVDTHIFRVSKRLGLIDEKASLERAHRQLEALVPEKDRYRFHLLLIQHGRKTCKARRPLCPDCVLNRICPGFAKLYPELAGEVSSV